MDYTAVIEQGGRAEGREGLRFTLEVETQAVLATAHHLLALQLRLPGFPLCEPGDSDNTKDPMRYAKLNRKRRVRRRWPGWRELHEGQLSPLIPEAAWSHPSALQRAVRWAGRAAAPKGRLRAAIDA